MGSGAGDFFSASKIKGEPIENHYLLILFVSYSRQIHSPLLHNSVGRYRIVAASQRHLERAYHSMCDRSGIGRQLERGDALVRVRPGHGVPRGARGGGCRSGRFGGRKGCQLGDRRKTLDRSSFPRPRVAPRRSFT